MRETTRQAGSMTLSRDQLAVGLLYLSWSLWASAAVLEKIEFDEVPCVTCEKGLIGCRVEDEVIQRPDSDYVYVRKLDAGAFLCCRRGKDCRPCLRIQTHITSNGLLDDSQLSGNDDDEQAPEEGFVSLCCNIPNGWPVCKRVEFKLPPPALEEHRNTEAEFSLSLLVFDKIYFGSQVLVSAQTQNQTIIIPSESDVCSSELRAYVQECSVPPLQTVIDKEKKVALLKLDQEDIKSTSPVEICQKYGEAGECRYQKWNGTNISIPLDSVAFCLCFQVRRRDGGLAWETCPFWSSREFLERTWKRVQVSIAPAQTNIGKPALAWKLTASCRLEAELWLCRMGEVGQECREVEGSRQQVENRSWEDWQTDLQGHWVKGEFLSIVPHPSLCVQVQVNGMDRPLDPKCPFSTSRRRWIFPVVLSALMICMAVLGACRLHSSVKDWVSRWWKGNGVRGAVCKREVVLLCPPDLDPTLAALVSRLGTALRTLGFGVTADLWSRAELGALGPVPWLHGQLDRLGRAGGQVVLILTRAAWEKVGQWGGAAGGAKEKEQGMSPYADVFSAALNCLLADQLQGGSKGRFTLVHFEALPSPSFGKGSLEPLSLHGLQPYALPLQSLPFLMELTGQSLVGLWPASRVLDRALRGHGEESTGPGDTGEAMALMGIHMSQTQMDWLKDTP
ncbi:uncharacterized protein LOC118211018 isoform X1 [Anguilla anguilla]|nr:uncharacterized protein LOC118211018 isoform X1 [Anguilla anguilla]